VLTRGADSFDTIITKLSSKELNIRYKTSCGTLVLLYVRKDQSSFIKVHIIRKGRRRRSSNIYIYRRRKMRQDKTKEEIAAVQT
jgi:hypothetical protein